MAKDISPKLLIERLENGILPEKPGVPTDSGYDLYACDVKRIYAHTGSNGERLLEGEWMEQKFSEPGVFELQCNERALIGTGIKATIGPGYELQIRSRSSLALKRGLITANNPGTVDEQYRGEICVIILNTSRKSQTIELGERIAQLVPALVLLPEIEERVLPATKRGDGGFGSTDQKKEKPFNVAQ